MHFISNHKLVNELINVPDAVMAENKGAGGGGEMGNGD